MDPEIPAPRTVPLTESGFGVVIDHADDLLSNLHGVDRDHHMNPLPRLLYEAGGLLVLRMVNPLDAAALVSVSRLFGSHVEDLRPGAPSQLIHPTEPQIFLVSTEPPACRRPPDRPVPPLTDTGDIPVTFPHRRGWHTDQSYRIPSPDVSLLHGVSIPECSDGQTLVADSTNAYDLLPEQMKAKIASLNGVHVRWGTGRSEDEVRDGRPVLPARGIEAPQRRPVVRRHPSTGRSALHLCDSYQMDWIEGPFDGLEPGENGVGANLLYELMSWATRPEFVYAHTWRRGDLLVLDNRSVIHAATWFDAERFHRVLWRTTVRDACAPEANADQTTALRSGSSRSSDGL